MTDSSGNLSVDFLVGFTIFMVAFIWVATLVPNLFLGVSAHGIDFDAVAYRTGVILAEDPGATILNVTTPWEVQPDSAKDNVERFGLAVSKETPNILSETKVNRFFNTTVFSYPDDYRRKVIFGNYPYSFNISLKDVEESGTRYIGDVRPDNYGFIRREVKIKHDSSNSTLIKANQYTTYKLNNTINSTYHDFAIVINTSNLLYGNITSPLVNPNIHDAYQINPTRNGIVIVLDDLEKPMYDGAHALTPGELNVTDVTLYNYINGLGLVELVGSSYENFIYDDTNTTTVEPPFTVQRCVTYVFPPGFFAGTDASMGSAIYINTTFHIPESTVFYRGKPFLNTTRRLPYDYNYNATDVTQPYLTDAVMEVAVW
ncbi:MAG: hypothetical protein LUO98_01775 [Methanoregula sp.]|nr:hypothetical protein [Methanoregula sp.]